jgi:hypothetical protein
MRLVARFAALIIILSLSANVLRAQNEQKPAPPNPVAPVNPEAQKNPPPPPNPAPQANTSDAAAPGPLLIAKVERIEKVERNEKTMCKGRGAPSSADGLVEVMAGDDLVITTTRALAPQARYEARFDAKVAGVADVQSLRVLAWPASSTTLVTRAPVVDSWQVRELRLVVDAGGTPQESANARPLRIAPAANAIIDSISPTVVQWGAPMIKVSGQGFFAPREQVLVQLGEITVCADRVSPAGDWFSAIIPREASNGNKYDAGVRDVSVSVWNVPAQLPEEARTANKPLEVMLWRAPGLATEMLIAAATLVTAAGIGGLLYGLYRTLGRERGLTAALLLDPETQTYSLARAQFFWWTTIIVLGYLFLFYGHGLHQGLWNFPPLEGFAYTFMISLGTLLVAQTTQAVKGPKGAGIVRPTPADLIVHGGVLAPERVQQVVWVVLAGVAFLWIVFKTYMTSTGLPTIPNEMLALMGISSAGYLGGKMARKPGPIIQRVEVGTGSVILRIFGQHLSVAPRILIDGVELARENVATLEPDPDNLNEFAQALKVTVPEAVAANPDEWFSRKRLVAIINADTQRAEWELDIPVITDITVGEPAADGQRTVTVSGSGIATGAMLILPDGTELPLTAEPGGTRATATSDKWPSEAADVFVRNAQMGRATFHWALPGSTAKTQTGGGTVGGGTSAGGTTGGAGPTGGTTTGGAATDSGATVGGTTTASTSDAGTAGTTNPADDPLRHQADQAAEGQGTAQTE